MQVLALAVYIGVSVPGGLATNPEYLGLAHSEIPPVAPHNNSDPFPEGATMPTQASQSGYDSALVQVASHFRAPTPVKGMGDALLEEKMQVLKTMEMVDINSHNKAGEDQGPQELSEDLQKTANSIKDLESPDENAQETTNLIEELSSPDQHTKADALDVDDVLQNETVSNQAPVEKRCCCKKGECDKGKKAKIAVYHPEFLQCCRLKSRCSDKRRLHFWGGAFVSATSVLFCQEPQTKPPQLGETSWLDSIGGPWHGGSEGSEATIQQPRPAVAKKETKEAKPPTMSAGPSPPAKAETKEGKPPTTPHASVPFAHTSLPSSLPIASGKKTADKPSSNSGISSESFRKPYEPSERSDDTCCCTLENKELVCVQVSGACDIKFDSTQRFLDRKHPGPWCSLNTWQQRAEQWRDEIEMNDPSEWETEILSSSVDLVALCRRLIH